jgi:(p)ppGpp synthase/HD superfamily hydrolase
MAAARFAAEAHHATGACVPGTALPYFYHVTLVAMETLGALAAEDGHDGDLAVQCALLHDVLEDAPVTADQLAGHFGPMVSAGVAALSKDPGIGDPTAQLEDSLRRIRHQPKSVWIVKLADRIANLQPPPQHWRRERILRYREGAKMILDALGVASPHLARRLADRIRDYPAPG